MAVEDICNTAHRYTNLFVWLAFCLLTLAIWFFHEPWGDEADAWLVARDGGIREILSGARLRGTPILWYLIQLIPAQLGLSYWVQGGLSLLIGDFLAAVFIFRAPFPCLIKVFLVFSSHYAFEYSVIARNYGLTVLFIFLGLAFFRTRHRHPIKYGMAVGLAANSSVHGMIFAVCSLLAEVVTRRRERGAYIAPLVMVTLIAVTIFQVWQIPTRSVLSHHYVVSTDTAAKSLAYAFVPVSPHVLDPLALGLAVIISLILTIAASRDLYAFILWITGLTSFLTLFVFVWWSHRHSGMIFTLAVSILWILTEAGKIVWDRGQLRWVAIFLVIPLASTVFWAKEVLTRPFSASHEAGNFIQMHYPTVRRIAVFREFPGLAVAPYLPGVRFYYLASGRDGTYSLWNDDYYRGLFVPQSEALNRLGEVQDLPLFLSTELVLHPEAYSLRLVFESSSNSIVQDKFWIYDRR